MSIFADSYEENSDFATMRQKVADVWIQKNAEMEAELLENKTETERVVDELQEQRKVLEEWENQKEPQPERTEAVIRNRQRLDEKNRYLNKTRVRRPLSIYQCPCTGKKSSGYPGIK